MQTRTVDYNQSASEYATHRVVHAGVFRELRAWAGLNPGSRALEVGCGTGNYITAMAETSGCFACGLDPSSEMLARVPAIQVRRVLGRAEELTFADDAFDLVFTVDVIHHVSDKAAFYRETARVLAPGGRLCTVTDSADMIRRREILSGYFPETVAIELGRYPRIVQLQVWMEGAGLETFRVEAVEERYEITSAQPFRDRAYSSLHLIPMEAWRAGLERLERDLALGPIEGAARYACVWARKPVAYELDRQDRSRHNSGANWHCPQRRGAADGRVWMRADPLSWLATQMQEGLVQRRLAAQMEFHISRQARDRYQFDESLFTLSGNVLFPNFHAVRVFAQKMNEKRDLVSFPEQAVKAGQINAMGLIDEISHVIVQLYRQQLNPHVMGQALDWLEAHLGRQAIDVVLRRFAGQFPPLAVYNRHVTLDAYLAGQTSGVPHREILLEEMLMLWLANANPAFAPFRELFDDTALSSGTVYRQSIDELHQFFETQPPFGPDKQNLIDVLRAPALAHPHSLSAQLEYIRQRWGVFLSGYLRRLLGSLDLIQEEEKAIFVGPGPALIQEYGGLELEPERFSLDRDWMPSLVLMAKNAYVWLHQLSQEYGRPITRLDDIPDEALDDLASWGFTGLWLIGLWERSTASRKIKQLCGNPEAVASAYSLYDYQIGHDLGGTAAYENLRDRAWQRGIRLASDMVPNHVGIYSRWVIEHPDWFVSLDHSPFPAYSFNGPDLSEDGRVGIFIEDHYYERSDAAVVFKRLDRWTGSESYIYHGNDGTSMPWNDTAQLNYLNPDVREAVIQTILQVARQFPIIRFDAAMTLAKKHYQRLWFPEPGTGGAIPTRAEHGLTKEEFDAAMPQEFWREVVDRVAAEAPDTLLLAEAFWLLEGYFVRTLGMHRVYNSAFMNMLRDEDNAKYRSVIKNTLEFEPEILKRFVSFMNNPDEESAAAQFGKGDKYFGICTLMVTLPGLPMFGHGQIEGYAEKYGMEYRRAYWDERPDRALMERHRREISPLLHRRHLFAEVYNFRLYDFYSADGDASGHVNEDVFAYSNRLAGERALVVYHNRYATARGWIRTAAAQLIGDGEGGERVLAQTTLGEGLGLRGEEDSFYIFRDAVTNLEYIRNGRNLHENGLYIELDAYKCHVFLDWREVQDNEQREYAQLTGYLNGRGVSSIEEALLEMSLQPVHQPFKELVNAGSFRFLMDNRVSDPDVLDAATGMEAALDEAEGEVLRLLHAISQFTASGADLLSGTGAGAAEAIAKEVRRKLEACLYLPVFESRFPLPRSRAHTTAAEMVRSTLAGDPAGWGTLLGWICTHALGKMQSREEYAAQSRAWIDEWLLGKILAGALQDLGLDEAAAWWAVGTDKVLINHQDWFAPAASAEDRAYRVLVTWLRDGEVQQFLRVNRYDGILWFNREAFDQLSAWMLTIAAVSIAADAERTQEEVAREIAGCYEVIGKLKQAAGSSEFQVVKLMEAAKA